MDAMFILHIHELYFKLDTICLAYDIVFCINMNLQFVFSTPHSVFHRFSHIHTYYAYSCILIAI